MPNANTSFDDNQITDPNHTTQYKTDAPKKINWLGGTWGLKSSVWNIDKLTPTDRKLIS